jgi:hypothetical protein
MLPPGNQVNLELTSQALASGIVMSVRHQAP